MKELTYENTVAGSPLIQEGRHEERKEIHTESKIDETGIEITENYENLKLDVFEMPVSYEEEILLNAEEETKQEDELAKETKSAVESDKGSKLIKLIAHGFQFTHLN